MEGKNSKLSPYLILVLGVIGISFGSIFTRLSTAPPTVIAFYRLALTVLLLTLPLLRSSGIAELKRLNSCHIALSIISGAFLALHFVAWITSLKYTSIASSTVLVSLHPLFVISLGSLFLKEKITPSGFIFAAIALAGSSLISFGDFRIGREALLGDLLAFAGAFFEAGYLMIGRSLRKHLSLLPYVFTVYGSAAILLLVFNILTGTPLYPYPSKDWLCFFALAVIPTICGHTVFNWALRYAKAALVSLSILGEPVGATILGMLIFGELPGVAQVCGGILVIIGLALFLYREKE
ncbi:MAG: DMT family transporter [Thermacetogeniaceae bacterium]